MLSVHKNHKAYYYIRDEDKDVGWGVWRLGKREIIYVPIAMLSPPE